MIRELICLVSLQASVFAMNWNEVIGSHNELFSDKSVVEKQYEAFSKSETPAIVDSRIKAIPICENHEELIDLRLMNIESRLALAKSLIYQHLSQSKYFCKHDPLASSLGEQAGKALEFKKGLPPPLPSQGF